MVDTLGLVPEDPISHDRPIRWLAHTDDVWVHPSELDTELGHWAQNRLPLLGDLLTTRWLEASQSLEVARYRFGVQGFDTDGQVVWAANSAGGSPW